jgi:hypothetical protein
LVRAQWRARRLVPPCLRVRRKNNPPDCFLVLLTTVVGLAATLAGLCRFPCSGRTEPDRQRAAALERFSRHWARTHGASMARLAGRFRVLQAGGRSAKAARLPHWIHRTCPSRDLRNRASPR